MVINCIYVLFTLPLSFLSVYSPLHCKAKQLLLVNTLKTKKLYLYLHVSFVIARIYITNFWICTRLATLISFNNKLCTGK